MAKVENLGSDIGISVHSKLCKNFPKFEKPRAIGYFNVCSDRIYNGDNASQLRYYVPPQPDAYPLNLNHGIENVIRKPDSAFSERLDFLLKYIYDNFANLSVQQSELQSSLRLKATFVCQRGILRLLMCSPFEYREDSCILVTHFNGTYYLCRLETKQDKYKRCNATERVKVMGSWGFKMEQYVLSDAPNKPPNIEQPVNECEEFVCVFKTTINDLKILYAAEMDGIISTEPVGDVKHELNNLRFIEIKTRKEFLNPIQQRIFRQRKTCYWWCQSFLVGIQDIFVGMRNDNGMVNRIEHMTISSICKEGNNFWRPSDCANFLVDFLTHVKKQTSTINCPHTTHIYNFEASSGRIFHRCVRGQSKYSFLPDWYTDLFSSRSKGASSLD